MGTVDMSGLQQKVKILEDEMNKNAMKLGAAESTKKALEAQVAHYEEKFRKMDGQQV